MSSYYQEFIRTTPVQVRSLRINQEPFACHSVYSCKAAHELCLPESTITWVLKGRKVVQHAEQTYELGEGEGLFLKSGNRVYSEKLWYDRAFESINLVFKEDLIREFLRQNPLLAQTQWNAPAPASGISDVLSIPRDPFLINYLHSLLPYFRLSDGPDAPLSRLKYFEALHLLVRSENGSYFLNLWQSGLSARQSTLQQVVEARYAQPLTLEALAHECGMSVSTFKRVFQQTYGASPRQWINRKRLELAYFYLKTTDQSITQIGYEVGFENLPYFIQCFRACYGFTPGQLARTRNESVSQTG